MYCILDGHEFIVGMYYILDGYEYMYCIIDKQE